MSEWKALTAVKHHDALLLVPLQWELGQAWFEKVQPLAASEEQEWSRVAE